MCRFFFPHAATQSEGLERKEGHPINAVSKAAIVPSRVVLLMELREQGWSHLQP
jgi:hypothetical protein